MNLSQTLYLTGYSVGCVSLFGFFTTPNLQWMIIPGVIFGGVALSFIPDMFKTKKPTID